ncbi:hypothetical protein BZG02_03035 [Labilibaculum filiforme]|uniref:ABC transporter substrate-binding protein n=1 Tax=Labilibaculum filiforme TaxID=1940526 RepID=A0A2N3I3F8_9BACT|nr:ABC transporter substrate-binding protein [Labilibaculum filiforme]PKQ64841.1 hypothetical protein BZG02_03035 [Labilibaculum filiforme]
MIQLKGIAWDHPRGYEPLIAASKEFSKRNPNVNIKWDIRSLKEFGDMPIEDLIGKYDFITIDHPYMGQADANNLLLNLKDKISKDVLDMHAKESVGASYQTYNFKNNLYALPVDAAALVAAYRKDLLAELGCSGLPKSREELFAYYKTLPSRKSVAWALCPTDFWCVFLTICAQDGGRDFIKDYTLNKTVGVNALNEIKKHLDFIHPESMNWNPIQILDRMGEGNEIVYSPYLFGYTNYSRKGYSKNLVHFTNSPVNPKQEISTIMGGVGLAISANCKEVKTAVDFVSFVADAKIQKGIYTKEGGQPGNLVAWTSKENNELCSDFFTNTMKTMKDAYIRPQHPMWNSFQEQGACLLHEGVLKNIESEKLMKLLNELYKELCNG